MIPGRQQALYADNHEARAEADGRVGRERERQQPVRGGQIVRSGLPATTPSVITMISAERMKSVRMAPVIRPRSNATGSITPAAADRGRASS